MGKYGSQTKNWPITECKGVKENVTMPKTQVKNGNPQHQEMQN